jgi:hypothetical protein
MAGISWQPYRCAILSHSQRRSQRTARLRSLRRSQYISQPRSRHTSLRRNRHTRRHLSRHLSQSMLWTPSRRGWGLLSHNRLRL